MNKDLINGDYIVIPKSLIKDKTSFFYYKTQFDTQNIIDYIQILELQIAELKRDKSTITANNNIEPKWKKNCELL